MTQKNSYGWNWAQENLSMTYLQTPNTAAPHHTMRVWMGYND